jgi:hypothetical protein
MTLRQYLTIMGVGTALAWSAVALIVFGVNPTETSSAVFVIFYASLFLAVTGTLSVIGFLLRVLVLRKQYFISRQVAVSFRQAVLLASLTVGALVLQSKSLLSWWTAALMIAAMTVLEFFFISAKTRR